MDGVSGDPLPVLPGKDGPDLPIGAIFLLIVVNAALSMTNKITKWENNDLSRPHYYALASPERHNRLLGSPLRMDEQ